MSKPSTTSTNGQALRRMKFAFSTVSCPKWDFETICSRAKEYGYGGVEIRGFLNESMLTISNVFLTEPAKLRAMFTYHGIDIACLASSVAMSWDKKKDRQAADEARRFIDAAAALHCPLVKIFDTVVHPGTVMVPTRWGNHSRASAAVAFGDWILPVGDYAAERGVTLLVEGALSFRSAKEMWLILDRLNHPSIACCWDVFNAALIGESPYVSVPTLNSRIQYAQVKDAKIGPLGATYCKLGEGDVPVQKFLTRLMGIGYDGWVTFEWEKAWLPNIAEPEEVLPHAMQKMREWTKPADEEEGDAKPKAQAAHAH
jgi:sugar phosphate isomerase/epimerase